MCRLANIFNIVTKIYVITVADRKKGGVPNVT